MKTLILILALLLPPAGYSQTRTAQLYLTWTDTNDNETGSKIERRLGQTGEFVEIAMVGIDSTQFYDVIPNDPGGTEYCYRLRAFNLAGDGPYSPVGCGTSGTVPTPPANAPSITVTTVTTVTVPVP